MYFVPRLPKANCSSETGSCTLVHYVSTERQRFYVLEYGTEVYS